MHRLKIFTWHIHGTYLYYLSKGDYDIYIPVNDEKNEGYYGRGNTFPFGSNVIEVDAENVRDMDFDCILFQTGKNFLKDQYDILSEEQRQLPRIYLEHDPPSKHPTDTRHVMNDPGTDMVHVTHFNELMWQSGGKNTYVIDHGIPPADLSYTGELEKGIVVVNHLHQRGRKTGADIFEKVKKYVPLDLVGMGTLEYGGLGEVLHPDLPQFISRYRFFFNPMRYTSLGLAVLEAMMIGMPIVATATTEYSTVITNGVSGFIHTDIDYLIESMQWLLSNRDAARMMGAAAKETAQQRFNIDRFIKEWETVFRLAITKNISYESRIY